VEVKSRDRDTLRWSDFKAHQIEALDKKTKAGARCMVLWVKNMEIKAFKWPIEGFKPGASLRWEE